MNPSAMRAMMAGVAPVVEPLANPALTSSADRYRLDPWAHVEDGHVRVLDLVTFQPVRFAPTQQQIEMVEAWIDLDHLRRTAQTGKPVPLMRNVHEEKTRQIGATTALAYALLWLVSYHDTQGFVLHVNGDEVDDGGAKSTYDSIFGKVRYMAEHGHAGPPDDEETFWPEHLRPGRYLEWRARPSIIRNRLNPIRYIRGAVQSPDPGRGRRYTHGLLDEAARLAWGEQVHAAITRAIPTGRFYNSTPFGKGNTYYRLRTTKPKGYTFLRHHWSEHPVYGEGLHVAGMHPDVCPLCAGNARGLKWSAEEPVAHRYPGKLTSPWFDQAILELTDEQVAQELEIDYEGSLTARVYPTFSAAIHVERDGIPYDKHLDLEFDIDYGWGTSATAIHVYQCAPGTPVERNEEERTIGLPAKTADELRVIAEVEMLANATRPVTPETVAAELLNVLAAKGIPLRALEPRFTRDYLMVGDPAGDARLATGGTLAQEYAKVGWRPTGGEPEYEPRHRAINHLLLGRHVKLRISGPDCPQLIAAFEGNRWPTDRTGTPKEGATKPVNDVHNDHMSAVSYYVQHRFPAPDTGDVIGAATADADARGASQAAAYESGRIDPGLSGEMKF